MSATPKRRRTVLAASASLALALTLAACSSSSTDAGNSTPTTSPTSSPASSSTESPAGSSAASAAGSDVGSADAGSAGNSTDASAGSSAASEGSGTAETVSVAGGTDGSTTFAVTPNPSLAADLPSDITGDGTLELVTDPSAAPYEFIQDGTQDYRGADVDLGNAIAAKLGLKANWSSVKFPGILASIKAKRYDFAMTAMGDTPEREKVVDFVDYSTDSNAIVVPKGNPKNISDLNSLCGLNVADLEGSVFAGLIDEQNEKCTDKMKISTFQDVNQVLLQVQTGRADATMYQTGIAGYIIKTSPDAANLEVLTNTVYGEGYNAIPFNKDNTALRDAVQKATQELVDDGTYKKIYDTWGLSANMIDKITVNDGLKYNQPS